MEREISALEEYRAFAVELAQEAGEITLRYFRSGVQVDRKSDNSPVTVADRETEAHIRRRISQHFPQHTIIGEESGEESRDSRYSWIIDPIDGTKAFIHGVPFYTVLIAFAIDQRPVAGVIHAPALEETVSAATGGGIHYNRGEAGVTEVRELRKARLNATDFAELSRRYPVGCSELLSSVEAARGWADAYGYLMLVTRRAELMLDPVMSLWDIAPLYPILEEAGAAWCDFLGRRDIPGQSIIAASSSQLLESAFDLLRKG
ncbi:MAG: inositol monophosphatase family protein [Spirochaetaceae bacterium]